MPGMIPAAFSSLRALSLPPLQFQGSAGPVPGLRRVSSQPLHPQTLNTQRRPNPGPGGSSGPPQNYGTQIDPALLAQVSPGMTMPHMGEGGSANPFQGNANPGAFTTPAPFNSLRAQMGGLGGAMRTGLLPRGPLGAFALAPAAQRPRSRNPFWRPTA